MKRKIIFIMASALMLIASQSRANIIQNGSFEQGPTLQRIVDVDSLFLAGNIEITGWTIQTPAGSGSTGSINVTEYPGYPTWVPSDGVRSVDLNGNSPGAIYQVFDSSMGATYRLEFDLAGNPDEAPAAKQIRVVVRSAGVDILDNVFSFDTTGKSLTNMGWEHKTLTFVANDGLAALVFLSGTSGVGGPALDNVSLNLISYAPHTSSGCSVARGGGFKDFSIIWAIFFVLVVIYALKERLKA